eukprot:GFYU01023694.1.p1 GENE.GFYU01023694.1~~GFYU01023694.1.p1  ORF type:complete len:161 (-),score=42.14 GFYU01023694.1:70-483(-)
MEGDLGIYDQLVNPVYDQQVAYLSTLCKYRQSFLNALLYSYMARPPTVETAESVIATTWINEQSATPVMYLVATNYASGSGNVLFTVGTDQMPKATHCAVIGLDGTKRSIQCDAHDASLAIKMPLSGYEVVVIEISP